VNPYPNVLGVISTLAVPVYQTYTPRHSASGSIDYELPLNGFTIRAHIDGNYDGGYYSTGSNPVYVGPGSPANVYQPTTDKAFVVNSRVALADVAMGGSTGARMSFAVWTRNLFNEQHLFYKSLSPTSGTSGFYNEPRTFGGEVNLRF
jgi:iron complex outermembrane receptor protein